MCVSLLKSDRSSKMQRMQIISPNITNSKNNNSKHNNNNGTLNNNCNYLPIIKISNNNNHLVPNSASMIGRFDDRLCVPYRIRTIYHRDLAF